MKRFLSLALLLSAIAWSGHGQEKIYSVFLIGDAGEPDPPVDLNLALLKKKLSAASDQSAVVFLGDNIYPKGLPPGDHSGREEMEQKLIQQLEITKDFKGRRIVIPGNHDWKKGKKDGFSYIIEQGDFVDEYFDGDQVFFPSDGCPGPVEISLNEEVTLIIVDTQWLLHPWYKPRDEEGCGITGTAEVLVTLNNMLEKNAHKKVMVVTHHPLMSDGIHGGHIPFKQHIFPLTAANESLYIPLPIIGSIMPFYRAVIGNIQDLQHPKYKAISKAMVGMFEEYPNTVHAAGHDHSLQLFQKNNVHYIVSGSGSKTTHVKKNGKAEYAASKNGFVIVDYFDNGDIVSEYWTVDEKHPNGELALKKTLGNRPYVEPETIEEFVANNDFTDSTVVTNASEQYAATKGQKRFFGTNYRDEWAQKIEVPVFDIGAEHGGLEIVQRGGGMQTKSLRLEADNGEQYVLRSIEKYPENAIPEALRKTFAVDIVQDQISAGHPYGAFVIPSMAEAAGIYHTNPKVVFIPDDPRFGQHQSLFANMLALYEERPAKDASNRDFFGNSEDVENTLKIIKRLKKDNDNEVDQPFVLRNRLFDMLIGDWDRHDDQWRWATFDKENDKGQLYRPVPRDRDQAFFLNEGFFPKIASKKWALPKLEGFDYEVDWPPGLMFNARYFDRTFLTQLDREDWIAVAEDVKSRMTDEVFENAIRSWPEEIYALSGDEIIAKLKSRRDNLTAYALEHYESLAKEVEVLGSNKHEHFIIDRINPEETKVTVWKTSKDFEKRKIIYERTFLASETDEIRLYGFKDEDKFEQLGLQKNKIRVRIIGGKDKDLMVNSATGAGSGKKTKVYDLKKSTKFEGDGGFAKRLSDDGAVNAYNRKEFQYDVLMPLLSGALNPDDGLFIGGGFIYTKHGWRKPVFKSRHTLLGNYAFATSAFNIKYRSEFAETIGKWDLVTELEINQPFNVANFFGLGNESFYDFENQDIEYYRARYQAGYVSVDLRKRLGENATFSIGSKTQRFEINVEDEEDDDFTDRFIYDTDINGLDPDRAFEEFYFTGIQTKLEFDNTDHPAYPTRGMKLNASLIGNVGINDFTRDWGNFSTDFSFFYSFQFPAKVTFANRTGYASTFGDPEFFALNKLGGNTNLRGFRRTRFWGESAVFNNTDLRIKLGSFRSYLFPGSFGIKGFYDFGRVWYADENSSKLHDSAGAGIWLSPLGQAVLALDMAFTEEENLIVFRFGFLF
ncbi:MAG: hypothetical protein AAGC88_01155 [Bacteroidota bacterium]